ncbi:MULTISPECIES: alternative oxidase [unclassified Coleofasciculus]|uniref:alternative oxidase n=1 Tax=Cyanophyceae TaxID=3028117 RepID=UPI001689760B|nr:MULTISPECIES: alternative oxidase [unclassified Coleofasciculus]MBD1879995.1 plastoquinol terminal oxidase [Coleofasciculus sp. FACHB-T130]MBD1945226.1 plastoquinol terminal oxidase [Coleofasciculus sp. FACHB-712]
MIRLLVSFLEFILKTFYQERWYARFYVLETIARVPCFAYLSVLHLYESLGAWPYADWIKVHFAESWNELHHLRIIEALGGGKSWSDRMIARIGVLAYYWILVFVYMIAPRSAYYFNQLVEEGAYHTYDKFLTDHEAELKTQPAPQIAIDYYHEGDLYMFDDFQISHTPRERRPKIENLYDVFVAIRNDEKEHITTMIACQQPDAKEKIKSPHSPEFKPSSEES